MTVDLAVIGAGPAGAAAAIAARRAGLSVTIIDANPAPGGQIYRAPRPALSTGGPTTPGNRLRAQLGASGAELLANCRLWHVERGFNLYLLGANGRSTITARCLIVATGALERHIPVPGWTLPGVIGLASATILLKSQGVLPGKKTVVAGSGPMLLLVANYIAAAGGKVSAVVDMRRRQDWLHAMATLALRPALLTRGAIWHLAAAFRNVPIYQGHALRRIEGDDEVARAVITPLDDKYRPIEGRDITVNADSVAYGFGLMPTVDVTGVLRAAHQYDASRGGWVASVDTDLATNIPGLFVCGEVAGIAGVDSATDSGHIAGCAAARHLGAIASDEYELRVKAVRRRLRRRRPFASTMNELSMPEPGLLDLITPETILCRCESINRGAIDDAIAAGCHDVNDLKSATRCGMGPCGGRLCHESAAMAVSRRTGLSRSAIGHATPRSPLNPASLDALAGQFDYGDLAFREPAPL